MAHAVRRGHIHALAGKEGCNPVRAWQQFFEGFPHPMRYCKMSGMLVQHGRNTWKSFAGGRDTAATGGPRPIASCHWS